MTATRNIHITASQPVSVYGLKYTPPATAESTAFTAYPTRLLGTNYCLLSRAPNEIPEDEQPYGYSEFAIVATASNTTVTIAPSTNADLAGYHWTNAITLHQGQAYQVASKLFTTDDVTGTRITSDKPIAVFAGVSECHVPAGYGALNPLVQEQLPVDSWGTQALAMGFAGRANGDRYRVLAAYSNTVVTITTNNAITNGTVMITITNAGQFIETNLGGPVEFQGSQPILVAHFANGHNFDGLPYGDPCEILLPPMGHYLMTNIVVTPSGFNVNYLNLIVAQAATNSTFLDVTNAVTNFVAIGTSGYYGAQRTVTTNGVHKVTSSQPVGVEVYGFGVTDAYGYFGGVVK